MKFLFHLPTIYFSYVLGCVVLCCDANPVDTMTDLLSYSGWRILVDENYAYDIIDRRGIDQTDRQVTWDQLTATPATEGNVDEKIRLTHQFLSCSYAKKMIDLCAYERGIGPQCRSMTTASEALECLVEYLLLIKSKHPMVSRMIGALLSLQQLSPTQTQFHKVVFEVLVDMRNYYQRKTDARPTGNDDQTTQKTVEEESIAVEEHAHLMSKRLLAFYNRFCWPIQQWNIDRTTNHVKWLVEIARGNHKYVFSVIKNILEKIIKRFKELHDNTSGFEYDPESNNSRIITYDPDTAARVTKLNQLLANEKWKKMFGLEIRERGSHYTTNVKDLLRIAGGPDGAVKVTKENVYAKLKQAHLLLSCKYATVLKKCSAYTKNMWTKCQESQQTACLDTFLKTLNENDPSMLRMINALSNFHEISPGTVYNKRVYDLLLSFKRFYDQRTTQPRNVRNVSSWFPEIVRDISEITIATDEFYAEFCWPEDKFNADYSGDNITIDVIGQAFKATVDNDTKLFAVFDGAY